MRTVRDRAEAVLYSYEAALKPKCFYYSYKKNMLKSIRQLMNSKEFNQYEDSDEWNIDSFVLMMNHFAGDMTRIACIYPWYEDMNHIYSEMAEEANYILGMYITEKDIERRNNNGVDDYHERFFN